MGGRCCATSHLLKLGPFPPNEVGRIAQHVMKGEGRKEIERTGFEGGGNGGSLIKP